MINKSVGTPLTAKKAQNSSMGSIRSIRKKTNFPKWLHKPIPLTGQKHTVEKYLRDDSLHTVCEEAQCPNRNECFASGVATFLIMGDTCTRNCSFCNIKHGNPLPLDAQEPERLSHAVKNLGLSYVVITSATRDDLEDGGAEHISKTITLLKRTIYGINVEVLVPDFGGNMTACERVIASNPDVFSHNIETVPSLFSQIRPEAKYTLSLQILRTAAEIGHDITIKSGFMVGLGETEKEVILLMQDLRESRVSILTIGQYLQPSKKQVPVKEFITPDQFDRYHMIALELGFSQAHAGPFVRSSYNAAEIYNHSFQ